MDSAVKPYEKSKISASRTDIRILRNVSVDDHALQYWNSGLILFCFRPFWLKEPPLVEYQTIVGAFPETRRVHHSKRSSGDKPSQEQQRGSSISS